MIRVLGTSNGYNIYATFKSDAHLEAHAEITDKLLNEAISKINYTGGFQTFEIKFDRVIGKSACVEIEDSDEVEFYRRKNRAGLTPFVRRDPVDANSMVLIIGEIPSNLGLPTVVTAFCGKLATREPWDPNIGSEEERKECKEFWSTHALCYDRSMIA